MTVSTDETWHFFITYFDDDHAKIGEEQIDATYEEAERHAISTKEKMGARLYNLVTGYWPDAR